MKLYQLPQDKANHFIYGFAIYFLSNLIFSCYYSLGIVFLFALGKEIYDQYKYGGFDCKDLLVTLLPAFLLFLKFYLK